MDNKIFYGLWIVGRGFLRSSSGKVVAFSERKVAEQLVKDYGQGAKIKFIDDSIVSLEQDLLKEESRRSVLNRIIKIWHS